LKSGHIGRGLNILDGSLQRGVIFERVNARYKEGSEFIFPFFLCCFFRIRLIFFFSSFFFFFPPFCQQDEEKTNQKSRTFATTMNLKGIWLSELA
jgi:hypothetical protein